MSTTRGVDASNGTPLLDWKAEHAAGVRFAIARISEGERAVDSRASEHLAGARGQGMVTGGYHFAWPNESCSVQAAHYVATVKALAAADPLFLHWLDLEPYTDRRNYTGRTAAEIKAWALQWVELVEKAFPHQQVGIYAGGPEWQAGHVPTLSIKYWLPAYPRPGMTWAQAEAHARPVAGSRPADFWQFRGGSGAPDLNLYYGTESELRAWAGAKRASTSSTPKPSTTAPRVWTVKKGQTLGAIALALGVSVASLASYNHIKNPNLIYPGQRITAPPSPTPAKPKSTPRPTVSTLPTKSTSLPVRVSPSASPSQVKPCTP